jgi:hypothetical protein
MEYLVLIFLKNIQIIAKTKASDYYLLSELSFLSGCTGMDYMETLCMKETGEASICICSAPGQRIITGCHSKHFV